MSASIKSNSSGNLELFSGSTKVLEANAGTGVVSGLKVAAGSATGQAVNYDQVIGVGQTWQDVAASRALGVTYTNTTGKPIMVNVRCLTSLTSELGLVVNGGVTLFGAPSAGIAYISLGTVTIPNNSTYNVFLTNGATTSNFAWIELR
jgi:hypothetical protein